MVDNKAYEFSDKVKLILKTYILLIFLMVFLYGFIETLRMKQYIITKFSQHTKIMESIFKTKILNAEQNLFQIAKEISQQALYNNSKELSNYLEHYQHQMPLKVMQIMFIDVNNNAVISKIVGQYNDKYNIVNFKQEEFLPPPCDESQYDFFKHKTTKLMYYYYDNKKIISLKMIVTNAKNKYVGTVFLDLALNDLIKEIQKNFRYDSEKLKIEILREMPENIKNISDLSLIDIIRWSLPGEKLAFWHKVADSPFFIKLKIKYLSFNKIFYFSFLFIAIMLLTTVLIVLKILKITDDFFKNPLISAQNKISALNKFLNRQLDDAANNALLANADGINGEFSPKKLAINIIDLVDKHYELLNQKKELVQDRLKTKQYFMKILFAEKSSNDNKEEKLVAAIKNIINEMPQTTAIEFFLCEIIDECKEFFQTCIARDLTKVKHKYLTINKNILKEIMFNIFAFIHRSRVLYESLAVFADLQNNNLTITIMVKNYVYDNAFAHSSLLSVYILAKENGLLLSLKKEGKDLYLILEPFLNQEIVYDMLFLNSCYEIN